MAGLGRVFWDRDSGFEGDCGFFFSRQRRDRDGIFLSQGAHSRRRANGNQIYKMYKTQQTKTRACFFFFYNTGGVGIGGVSGVC